jgi:hypothetical protein
MSTRHAPLARPASRPLRTAACAIAVTLGACADPASVSGPAARTEEPRTALLFPAPCSRTARPDLVVSRITSATTFLDLNDGSKELPVELTVENRGGCAAGAFELLATVTTTAGYNIHVGFHSASATIGALAAGESRLVRGTVFMSDVFHGEPYVDVTVTADGCTTNTTGYCQVSELDERNNRSAPIRVTLAAPQRW